MKWEYRTFHIDQMYTMGGSVSDVYLGSSEICCGSKLFRYTCSADPNLSSNINFSNIEKLLCVFVDEIIATHRKNRCLLCLADRPVPLVFYGCDLFRCKCKYETYHESCISNHIRNFGINKCPQCNITATASSVMTIMFITGMYMLFSNPSIFAINIITFAIMSNIKDLFEKMHDYVGLTLLQKITNIIHYVVGLQPPSLTITAYLHTPTTTVESIIRYAALTILTFGFIGVILVVFERRANKQR